VALVSASLHHEFPQVWLASDEVIPHTVAMQCIGPLEVLDSFVIRALCSSKSSRAYRVYCLSHHLTIMSRMPTSFLQRYTSMHHFAIGAFKDSCYPHECWIRAVQ
jgi:hypothetical protein